MLRSWRRNLIFDGFGGKRQDEKRQKMRMNEIKGPSIILSKTWKTEESTVRTLQILFTHGLDQYFAYDGEFKFKL